MCRGMHQFCSVLIEIVDYDPVWLAFLNFLLVSTWSWLCTILYIIASSGYCISVHGSGGVECQLHWPRVSSCL